MKKIIAIILVCLCTMLLLCACKPAEEMGDMVETMISTVLSTESQDRTDNSVDNGVNGTINDHDGYIGNEGTDASSSNSTQQSTTDSGSVADDNVL
ncbi:MAG: hypothetical protein IJA62_02460 [Ruminococcus sp.]|nr:hypothetical protein [Ruminococcus sp.]